MAKDGTHRGGRRPGAGRKPNALAEKLKEGKRATALTLPDTSDYNIPDAIPSPDIPPAKDYLNEEQRTGTLLGKEIYDEMFAFIDRFNCTKIVSPLLVEQFALAQARHIQLEQLISTYGFAARHPTTGNMIGSPFPAMSQAYLKLANMLYQEIYAILQANSRETVTGDLREDMLERILSL